jgi:hypothetical protein
MNPENIATFTSYSGCVDQRLPEHERPLNMVLSGQSRYEYAIDDFPHGAMGYGDLQNQIIFLQQLVPMVLSYLENLKS